MKAFFLALVLIFSGCSGLNWIPDLKENDTAAIIVLDDANLKSYLSLSGSGGKWNADTVKFNFIPIALASGDTIFTIPDKYITPSGIDTTRGNNGFDFIYNWIRPNGEKGTREIKEIRQVIILRSKLAGIKPQLDQ